MELLSFLGGSKRAREKEETEEAKKPKSDPWADGNIHDHETMQEWTGNFVVLGTTGSGKTTFIRFMTNQNMRDVGKHGDFKMSTDSVTVLGKGGKKGQREAMKVESPFFKRDGVNVKLCFRDTVGFGAKDMESKDILKETVAEVAGDFERIRGCILVHKCERYRTGGAEDVEEMKRAMKTLNLDFNKHLLLVITHSAHLTKEKQEEYSAQIRTKISGQIPLERVIHVNFVNLGEVNEDFREIYRKMAPHEFEKVVAKLMEFETNVCPAGQNFKEHFVKTHFPDSA
jgi:hypothetical protein